MIQIKIFWKFPFINLIFIKYSVEYWNHIKIRGTQPCPQKDNDLFGEEQRWSISQVNFLNWEKYEVLWEPRAWNGYLLRRIKTRALECAGIPSWRMTRKGVSVGRKSLCTGAAGGTVCGRRQVVLWGIWRQQTCSTSIIFWTFSNMLPSFEIMI